MNYSRLVATTLIVAGAFVWWGCPAATSPVTPVWSIVIPSSIDFGKVKVGAIKDTGMLLTNGILQTNPGDTAQITSQSFSSPLFQLADPAQATLKIAPSGYVSDSIQFIPKDTNAVTAYDTLRSNGLSKVITLLGGGIARTRILFVAPSVNFGNARLGLCADTLLGAPAETIILIYNFGNDTLRIHSVTSQSSQFPVISYDSIIPPSGSTSMSSIAVRFCPSQLGPASGTLVVNSNATQDSSQTITLNGIGIPYSPLTGSVYTYAAQQLDTAGKPIGNPYSVTTTIIATGLSYQGKSNVTETSDSNYFEVESDGDISFYAPGFQTYPPGTVAGSGWLTLPFAGTNSNPIPLISDDTTYIDSAGMSISLSVRDTATLKGMTTIPVAGNSFPTSHVHLTEDALYSLPKQKIYVVGAIDFFYSSDLGYLATRAVVINKLTTNGMTRKLTNLNGERRVLTSFNLK